MLSESQDSVFCRRLGESVLEQLDVSNMQPRLVKNLCDVNTLLSLGRFQDEVV